MPERIHLDELATMSPGEFADQSAALVAASHKAGTEGSPTVERRIRQFEARYEMDSTALRQGLAEGTIKETADISAWLFLLDVRNSRAVR